MKKFLNLLLMLPVMLFVASCDDDDKDFPQVTFTVEYDGAYEHDGALYVVQGETLTIKEVNVTPLPGTKAATLGPVTYVWDYEAVGTTVVAPYTVSLSTAAQPEGRHLLQIFTTVAQVDKSIASANMAFDVIIVGSTDDIPGYGPDIPDEGTQVAKVSYDD